MNKKVLLAGVLSTVTAAVPVVGAFAATGTSVSDNITLTVSESCTIGDVTGTAVTATLTPAAVSADLAGSKISITCNASTGWQLSAIGAGTEGHTTDLWNATASKAVPTSATIDATHTAWGFKVTGTGTVATYNNYAAVPSTATVVASSKDITTANVITVNYKISNKGDLPVGSYTGKVTYTLAKQASS